jgi:hypothetical protein
MKKQILNAGYGLSGVIRNVLPWAALLLVAGLVSGCGGGGSSSSPALVAAAPVSATALSTAQPLTVGTAMTNFSPLTPTGGTPPYTYSITSGTLPAGVTLNNSTGVVSGNPTAVYSTASVRFQVQDAGNTVAATTSAVNFTVGQASNYISAIATTTAQSLTVGTSIGSFSPLTPSGGVQPYTYSVRAGTLPAGLSLDSVTGAVTGTPSAAYTTANVTFGVQDANFAAAGATSTVSFTVAALPAGFVYQGGLTWMPITATNFTWAAANTFCTTSTINGTLDWRLPTITELSGLTSEQIVSTRIAIGNTAPSSGGLFRSGAFINQGWALFYTWSSTPDTTNPGTYFEITLFSGQGRVDSYAASMANFYATCVR